MTELEQVEDRYRAVRDFTESLAAPLSPEDQCVQSMPDVSPTQGHRAHVTWFFETFVLVPHAPGYVPCDEHYGYLFNSYYEAVGDRHPRAERGLVTRPGCEEVKTYRQRVDEEMVRFIRSGGAEPREIGDLIELGLHHEQQHQELLLMDIKHVLAQTPVRPEYCPSPSVSSPSPAPRRPAGPLGWVARPGAITSVGHDGVGFHFDNEGPRHEVLLHPHHLADRLVTNAEWMEFMADGGYRDPARWLSDGWHAARSHGWEAPAYWCRGSDGWSVHSLHGTAPVDPAEPVVHVSYYEADAFARWAGARLPTEFEWEAAAAELVEAGRCPDGSLHPWSLHPHPAPDAGGLRQMFGDVWEWTSSAYAPYPGFRPAAGAVGEYNGKFMVDQQVLRGGACITPVGHVRASYRNFFPAGARWMFGGVRLAKDAS